MPIHPRLELASVPPVVHGGFKSAGPEDALDFSSNVNPYGASPHIWDAMRAVPINRHPDPRAAPLRSALADYLQVSRDQVIAGNGSVELIYHLANAYLRPGDRVLVVGPTFGEYAAAAQVMGAEVVAWAARAADDFRVDVESLVTAADRCRLRLIHICNPNNPTGAYLPCDAIERLLTACPDSLVVLDEAFYRFAAVPWDSRSLLRHENLVILRSLTKDYALTALRAGYALAQPPIIDVLDRVQPPWSVNALAQAAAIEALRDDNHLRSSLAALASAKTELIAGLVALGLAPVASAVHFMLVPVPSAPRMTRQLADRHILVRDCTSFGLPDHIRIATQRPEQNARLLAALAEVLRAE